MSLMDREYMRRDSNSSKSAGTRKTRDVRLAGLSRSERISLAIGALAITALLMLALI